MSAAEMREAAANLARQMADSGNPFIGLDYHDAILSIPLPDDEGVVEKVARALLVSEREAYANSPELLDEHFEWWRAGKDNPDSCVHYSSIGIAVRQARTALRAINGGKP